MFLNIFAKLVSAILNFLIINQSFNFCLNSENVSTPKVEVLNVEFALKLRIYRSLKSLICLKWIRKKFTPTLHVIYSLSMCNIIYGIHASNIYLNYLYLYVDPAGLARSVSFT